MLTLAMVTHFVQMLRNNTAIAEGQLANGANKYIILTSFTLMI